MPDSDHIPEFCHLHNHTQYSLLDGASNIDLLLDKAVEDKMPAVAITDHGNMFGAMNFYNSAKKRGVKPIIGCEFYMVPDRHKKKFDRINRDERYHQLIMAKNAVGYKNISRLSSLGFIEGLYGKYPRIDFELLEKYKEGLIGTTCCAAAMVPRTFLQKGPEEAEQAFLKMWGIFGDDYYIEIQRHGSKQFDEDGLNLFLMKMSDKYHVKMIATNDSHYINQDDYVAHDILLCVSTGSDFDAPKRFRFENDQFYFKTRAEMYDTFRDMPQALENTMEIVEKVSTPSLNHDILLPNYTLPGGFESESKYLRFLCYEGAKKRYGELSADLIERLDYELRVINEMGFSGYFLIVQDLIRAARKLNVWVGPGRGSAAGSVVAYCTSITNLDPIKYHLLFERFLNPERVNMPDIDIDFDDDGRSKVIDYVIEKYGKNQVAQIVTFGRMAARSSIRDVSRVLKYPLNKADKLAKMVPDDAGMTLAEALKANPDLQKIKNDKKSEASKVFRLAERLEGSLRQRGIHAAGVIIAPDDITQSIPVCTTKDSDLLITQFEGKLVESAGMLKMDFLGLKTLPILKDAVENVRKNFNKVLDLNNLPLDDEKTLKLFQKGRTIGIFQFESEGMRKYLKDLKPSNLEDLIAMNALFRPGPIKFIPLYIDRKLGKSKIEYPHPLLKGILESTYGIMVFQEQIMQTAQIIAGFSLGSADILRRAMGKKKHSIMDEQEILFIKGAIKNGLDEKQAKEIFSIMAQFAEYGFNRSHSAAYAYLAYQAAYLKANYPAEYMAAVLTHNMGDTTKLNFILHECRQMKIPTLGPDINESEGKFTVNKKGEIRYGLSGIKGLGEAAVEHIIQEKLENSRFETYFDFVRRVNAKALNKKCVENLAKAGAFDSFGIHRAQFFFIPSALKNNLIESSLQYAQNYKKRQDSKLLSLFDNTEEDTLNDPPIPECEPWDTFKLLQLEKEVTGIYLSGDPLEDFKLDIKSFCTHKVAQLVPRENQRVKFAGVVTEFIERLDKKGRKFGRFSVEDNSDSIKLGIFREDFLKYRHLLEPGTRVFISGIYKKWGYDSSNINLDILEVMMLEDLRERKIKSIALNIQLDSIDENLIGQIAELCKKFKGKYPLKISVSDPDEKKVTINMRSSALTVKPENELFEHFEKCKGVQMELLS